MSEPGNFRPSYAMIDLDAVAHNVRALKAHACGPLFCAVVKADGYGHGAVHVARAALNAGADVLAVALVEEAVMLREAGISARLLLLSEPPPGSEDMAVALDLEPTVYTLGTIAALASAAARVGACVRVHLKVNTGMNRVGALPAEIVKLAQAICDAPQLDLAGVCTHFAVADEVGNPGNAMQLDRFRWALRELAAAGIDPAIRHAANTAAMLADPKGCGFDMVRCGIGIYGVPPAPSLADVCELRPAMSLHSVLSHVMYLPAGERISYGHTYELEGPSWIGMVPLGYADGVRRGLSCRADVLVRECRRSIAGTITMDQFLVDLGTDEHIRGEEVVLIGRQGDEQVTVEDWASVLDTIGYEITCGIGARVPRRHVGG